MSYYDSNSTMSDSQYGPRPTPIPFIAYLRYVPTESGGRRLVTMRDGQNTARMIQEDLQSGGWTIATPVTFVPQFGNKTARITVHGFFDTHVDGNFHPTTQQDVIHSGTVPGEKTSTYPMDPGGGNLAWGQDTVTQLDDMVADLVTSMEIASDIIGEDATIDQITVMGVNYGRGGRSFPA